MCGVAGERMLPGMESDTTTIRLELRLTNGCLSGQVRNGHGDPAREFSGWLGLLAAIDALLPDELAHPASLTGSRPRRTREHHHAKHPARRARLGGV